MRAIACTKYGSPEVLVETEIEKPVPKDDEVLIKIYASAVTASDVFIRSSELPLSYKIPMRLLIGIRKPRKEIIGIVLAGKIEATSSRIKRFKVGDKVYGLTGFQLGCYAEYKCMKEIDSVHGCLAKMPDNLSFEEATSAAYGGLLALQYIEKGKPQSGQHILIYGASSTTGTIAIQLAKNLGLNVTAVCSTKNIKLAKQLGADTVLDYTKQNEVPEGAEYDLMLDAVGKMKTSQLRTACRKALKKTGRFVSIDDGDLKLNSERLERISGLVEQNKIKPILDRTYPLSEIREAHRYVQNGHKVGGVAIQIVSA